MSKSIRVLYVDADPDFADLTAAYLEGEDGRFAVETATNAERGMELQAEGHFDCLVAEYELPDTDGVRFLKRVRDDAPDLPFVVFTDDGSEEVASAAIAEGVTDYLRKGGEDALGRLGDRIENAVQPDGSGEVLPESGEKFDTSFENLPGIVYRCRDESGWPIEEVRGDCESLSGYSTDDLSDRAVRWRRDVVHPDDQREVIETLRSALGSGRTFEVTYRIVTAAGETKRVWERAWSIDGDVFEGFVTDVVDRDELESSVLPQYRRLLEEHELVLDRMTDVFTALDTDWRITYLNEGGRRAIVSNLEEDLSKEELIGRHFWSINPEFTEDEIAETALYQSCHEAMERQEVVAHEKYYENEDYWVYTWVYPSDTGVSIFSRDITERKKKEQELERRIEQLEEYERQIERLEEFAGIVSHDLRNPLNVAQGRLELARETGDLDHLEEVARSHDRMAALVEDLLVLAREGSEIDSLDRVELPEQIEESWGTVETPDASIDVQVDRTIRAESSRLAQLFENLFRNSVEHGSTSRRSISSPEDTAEHSSTSPPSTSSREDAVEHSSTSPPSTSSREDAVEHSSTSPDSQARQDAAGASSGEPSVTVRVVPIDGGFAVEDDGPGIPAGEREKVFEPGYSADEDGTGFGLQIVKDVADAHGWEVTLTDGREGGARFEFTGVEGA